MTDPVFLTQNLAELWLAAPGFEDLLLLGENTDADGFTYTIKAMANGAAWGVPAAIDVEVQRWMTDGAVATTQGHNNRTITFQVVVSAATTLDLAMGEAALVRRASGPAQLRWTSPEGDGLAPTTVLEVWTWHLEHALDIDTELRLARGYTVTMTAKPWARSFDLSEVDALVTVASPVITSIDSCTSLTGWTGSPNAPTQSAGAVHETNPVTAPASASSSSYVVSLTRTGAVSGMLTTPYLLVDAIMEGGWGILSVTADGVPLTRAASLGSLSWWLMPDGVDSFTTLVLSATVFTTRRSATVRLNVADLSKTDSPGGVGTHKQLFRSLDVGGSVPTSGSIEIASPSATALGTTLLYTGRDTGSGYVPSLRRHRTEGRDATLASDGTAVSGFSERIDALGGYSGPVLRWTLPGEEIVEAAYAVVARLKCAATGRQGVSVLTYVGNTSGFTPLNATVNFLAANTWQWCVLGITNLPPLPVPPESQGAIDVQLFANPILNSQLGVTDQQITVDETYLLDVTNGAVTILDSVASTRVWIDAPDADPARNRPAIFVGGQDDRSDAVGIPYWQVTALGDHDLYPEGTVLFTVTDGVADALGSASFYRRWHTHAGA